MIITFKARNSYSQGPAHITPIRNPKGGFYGITPLSEEERRKEKHIVDSSTVYVLTHNQTLDLSDPYNQKIWDFLQYSPLIVQSEEDFASQPLALFCLSNEEVTVSKAVTLKKEKLELQNWILSLTHGQRLDVCRLIGNFSLNASPVHIEDYLLSKAIETSGTSQENGFELLKRARKWMGNSEGRVRLFLKKLLEKKIIQTSRTGEYWFGDPHNKKILGFTEEQAISYLDNPDNQAYVRYLYTLLGEEEQLVRQKLDDDKQAASYVETEPIPRLDLSLYVQKTGLMDTLLTSDPPPIVPISSTTDPSEEVVSIPVVNPPNSGAEKTRKNEAAAKLQSLPTAVSQMRKTEKPPVTASAADTIQKPPVPSQVPSSVSKDKNAADDSRLD